MTTRAAQLTWPPKAPNELKDYYISWDEDLDVGEKIATSTWELTTLAGDEITIDADDLVSGERIARVWLSGGGIGGEHVLTNKIVTDNSEPRTYERSAKLRVRAL